MTPLLEPEPSTIPFAEELPAARQVYKAAKLVIQQAMEDVRMGRALNMEAVSDVVGSMADSILRSPDALTSLARLKQFDEYTFFHSVNTSALALSVGKHLGYARTPLLQLGTGMLLHDIGKMQIPVELLNKPGRYEADEFEIMKQHVLRGADILSNTTGLTDMFLKPTLEHHERVDGTGYPHHRSKTGLSQFGLIAAIVDIYDAVTSDRCYHKGKTPHDTLQFLYQLGIQGHVDGALVQQFIQVVGVYPVGSCVSLNTRETGIVKQFNHHAPIRPLVVLITDEAGHHRSTPVDLDLAAQFRQPERIIASTLDPTAFGIGQPAPADELLKSKRSMVAVFALTLERPAQIINYALTSERYGFPDDYWDKYPDQIMAVTAADVERVAKKYLNPDAVQIVAVGDAAKVKPMLAPWGTVTVYGADGRPQSQ